VTATQDEQVKQAKVGLKQATETIANIVIETNNTVANAAPVVQAA
jgi:hypothetical protein